MCLPQQGYFQNIRLGYRLIPVNKSMPSPFWEPTRRHSRLKAVLPVQVDGNDAFGNAFQQIAHTLDISLTGARLGAIHRPLRCKMHSHSTIGVERWNFVLCGLGS